MTNEDRTIWMVFNGEIYNFLRLRTRLESLGHIFKSGRIVKLSFMVTKNGENVYLKRYLGCSQLPSGMRKRQALILARDRVGEKPLFYSESNGTVTFASDIKSVVEGMDTRPEIDYKAMDAFLAHICVPHPFTIFKNVRKVPPAHYMIFDKHGTRGKQYWFLDFHDKISMKEEDYLSSINELLQEAVKDRLVSDVPLGAF